jgi:hypothetical protein
MPVGRHASHHARDCWKSEKRPIFAKHLDDIRELTKAWHRGEFGRRWHSQHAKEIMDEQKKQVISLKCKHCGRSFLTLAMTKSRAKFCSNACKSAFRRKSGCDDIVKVCSVCQKPYLSDKYAHNRTCSRKCAAALRFGLKQGKSPCG